jgi:phosphoribosyl-AMP cyclohydrolase
MRGGSLSDQTPFASPGTDADLEEGLALTPKFDANGLVTCVATDAVSGDVLMVAHMNAEALAKTIASGEAWYFSRSRNALWRKGESSGHTQRVVEMRIDCDQDAVWIKVEQVSGACHTGWAKRVLRRSNSAMSVCSIRKPSIANKSRLGRNEQTAVILFGRRADRSFFDFYISTFTPALRNLEARKAISNAFEARPTSS